MRTAVTCPDDPRGQGTDRPPFLAAAHPPRSASCELAGAAGAHAEATPSQLLLLAGLLAGGGLHGPALPQPARSACGHQQTCSAPGTAPSPCCLPGEQVQGRPSALMHTCRRRPCRHPGQPAAGCLQRLHRNGGCGTLAAGPRTEGRQDCTPLEVAAASPLDWRSCCATWVTACATACSTLACTAAGSARWRQVPMQAGAAALAHQPGVRQSCQVGVQGHFVGRQVIGAPLPVPDRSSWPHKP